MLFVALWFWDVIRVQTFNPADFDGRAVNCGIEEMRAKDQLDIFASTMEGRASIAHKTGLLDEVRNGTLDRPLMVSVGLGVDAVAATIALVRLGARIDLAIFSDTGGEKPETYEFGKVFDAWLREHAGIPLTMMRLVPPTAPYSTLEEEVLTNQILPSSALGMGSCSSKWKGSAIHSWIKGYPAKGKRPAQPAWQPAIDCWEQGKRVVRVIGFDAGPKDRRRKGIEGDDRYQNWFVLRELGMDRIDCANEIIKAGLPLPIKSSCSYCPHNKPAELFWLHAHHPELFIRALVIENNGMAKVREAEGMWRKTRSSDGRPGNWNQWALQEGLIALDSSEPHGFRLLPQANPPLHYPDDEIERILAENPHRKLLAA
jgi:hypothetical protein